MGEGVCVVKQINLRYINILNLQNTNILTFSLKDILSNVLSFFIYLFDLIHSFALFLSQNYFKFGCVTLWNYSWITSSPSCFKKNPSFNPSFTPGGWFNSKSWFRGIIHNQRKSKKGQTSFDPSFSPTHSQVRHYSNHHSLSE